MPRLSDALYRHAAYYATLMAHAETHYLEGGDNIQKSLALFDRERSQIGAASSHLLHQTGTPEGDELLLFLANATAYIGDLRFDIYLERIPVFESMLSAARRLKNKAAEGIALGNLGRAYADLGDVRR